MSKDLITGLNLVQTKTQESPARTHFSLSVGAPEIVTAGEGNRSFCHECRRQALDTVNQDFEL